VAVMRVAAVFQTLRIGQSKYSSSLSTALARNDKFLIF
jgi:hypothetical protein